MMLSGKASLRRVYRLNPMNEETTVSRMDKKHVRGTRSLETVGVSGSCLRGCRRCAFVTSGYLSMTALCALETGFVGHHPYS